MPQTLAGLETGQKKIRMILPYRAPCGPSPLFLAAFLLQLGALQPGQFSCADPARLVPGAPRTLEIKTDEVHSYPVDLDAGDFLRVAVDQEGIDVAVELRGPDGRRIALVDGPGPVAEYGTEDLAALAASPGLHTIQVRGGVKNEPRARYRIRLESPRPAQADDRLRVEAVLANQEATNAIGGPGDTRPRQAELREKALRIWRDLGETAREADTLFQLGILRTSLGQADQASPLLQRAVELYGQVGDDAAEAKALNQTGLLRERVGDSDRALADYQQALDLARRAGARQPHVNALTNAARLLKWRGRQREALNDLQEALRLSEGLTCDGCQGGILIGLGSAYDDLGDTRKAVSSYREALKVKDLPRPDQGAALNNLGLGSLLLGDAEKALESFQRAAAINVEPTVFVNQGIALERLGRPGEARAQYTRALGLARQARDLRAQISTLHVLGNFALKTGRKDEALASWRELQALAKGHAEHAALAVFTRGLARRESGDLAAARGDLLRSRRLSRDRGDRGWESVCGLELAQAERKGGRFREALAHLEAAIEIVESQRNRISNPNLRATYLGSKQRFYELSIAILMDLHCREPAGDWDVRALRASERARARGLLDLLAEIRTDLRKGVDPKLLEKEAELRAEINARDLRRQELSHEGAGAEEELARVDRGLEEALSEFDDAETELRKSSPAYAALTQPQPLDAAAIQSRVLGAGGEGGAGALLLEYSLGEEKSYLWAVSPTAVRSFELPGRQDIEALALDAYDKMTREDADPAAADRAALAISRTVLGPVERWLTAGGTLLVVSDGMLQYIPFAALPLPSSPGERLINRRRVVSLPSASTLAVLRDELRDRPQPPKTLAILAHPVFRRDDPRIAKARRPHPQAVASSHRGLPPRGPGAKAGGRADTWSLEELPWSEDEARAIAGMVPDPRQKLIALDFDASVDTVLQGRLGDYRYVHFATHGFLDNMRPQMSSLALSRFDREGRALEIHDLRLQDIYNLQLNADLVVLSACRTALGKEIQGEGLMGLTRGFMYAGSARVLASLWSVEDRATSKLMEKFYRHLLGERLPPAEALRRAQLDLAGNRRWSRPYFWAGFSLQGEWR
jgi:CHAT domain-containing protein/Flp pilus assembly protein TadD